MHEEASNGTVTQRRSGQSFAICEESISTTVLANSIQFLGRMLWSDFLLSVSSVSCFGSLPFASDFSAVGLSGSKVRTENCRTFPDESAVAAPVVTPQDWGLLCHCVHSLKLILFFQRGTCVALDGRFSAVHLATLSDRILFSTHSTK